MVFPTREIACNLRIVRWDTLYGSHAYEDPEEVRDDKEIECVYIEFESTIEKGRYDSSRGEFLSFLDAISEAKKMSNQKIDWKKKK
ncbi:hypothetical protein [Desulfosporosinus sp. Sb-LF]|uniref:hypothetical protein n=1 Tax=Desulfosporosinus sp. Sb-LF TaxID=2560027 RepID=UPI00107F0C76|nr:hypothetical protein [Desulfosporosinus sp. Sb-LF]TGE31372.1 hypothetical protein E4K68_17415 [Desulfosporosinus sp. Sb-LF]